LLAYDCIIRDLPEERHGFNVLGILGVRTNPETKLDMLFHCKDLSYDLSYDTKYYKLRAVVFSDNIMKEEFFVVVNSVYHLPWISVKIDTTRVELKKFMVDYGMRANLPCIDQMSQPLRDGKEVSATVKPGVKVGRRVFFLDICIRDVR
jgi:hypothetical protein